MEVKIWTYPEFPEFPKEEIPEGAHVLMTTGDETGTRYVHNVEYETVGGTKLTLQILMPRSRNLPRMPLLPPPPGRENMVPIPGTACKEETALPCVIYVQGSAWMMQDVYGNLGNLARLAERGYVVAVVQYRHSGIAPYPACAVDARNAVRFMRKNAKTFFVDPDRMVIGGDSSGGHTAMMAAIRHNDDTDENAYPGISGEIRGVLDMYGSVSVMMEDGNPTTLNHHQPDSPEGMEMGFVDLRERPDLCRELTVETHLTPKTEIAPVLIFHGTKDRTVNTRQSVSLYNRLKACGKEAWLYLIEGGDHGGPEYWTKNVIDLIDSFYQHCLNQ